MTYWVATQTDYQIQTQDWFCDPLLVIGFMMMGAIFYFMGKYMKKHPPKNINHFYGYRTSRSMKSQTHWDRAQIKGAENMKVAGLVYIGLGLVSLAVPRFAFGWSLFIFLLLTIAGCIWMFWATERELENHDNLQRDE